MLIDKVYFKSLISNILYIRSGHVLKYLVVTECLFFNLYDFSHPHMIKHVLKSKTPEYVSFTRFVAYIQKYLSEGFNPHFENQITIYLYLNLHINITMLHCIYSMKFSPSIGFETANNLEKK